MELTEDKFGWIEKLPNPLDVDSDILTIKCGFDRWQKLRDEILFNQKVVQVARIAIKECPLGLCAYCAGLRLVLGDEPWK